MTPQDHNKFLGYAHLAYAGFHLVLAVMFSLFFFLMFSSMPNGRGGPPPFFVPFFFMLFFGFFYGVLTIPSIVAGYALLKKKTWARTAAIVGGVVAAMQFPTGTAVCVYTFWFLFSEPGKALYDKPAYALPPGRETWDVRDVNRQRENQYVPPKTPPDWR